MCRRRRSRGFREDADAGELQWLEDSINLIGAVFIRSIEQLFSAIFRGLYLTGAAIFKKL
jgi:hypothetical protein